MARQVLLVALTVFTHGILLVAGESVTCNATVTCENGGTCGEDDTCICAHEYTGELCLDDVNECTDNNPCQNAVTCNNLQPGYSCECEAGWTGTNCESELGECDSDPCKNAGTCTDAVASYTCACATGWTGINCESESGASLSTASCLVLALALALTKMATD